MQDRDAFVLTLASDQSARNLWGLAASNWRAVYCISCGIVFDGKVWLVVLRWRGTSNEIISKVSSLNYSPSLEKDKCLVDDAALPGLLVDEVVQAPFAVFCLLEDGEPEQLGFSGWPVVLCPAELSPFGCHLEWLAFDGGLRTFFVSAEHCEISETV